MRKIIFEKVFMRKSFWREVFREKLFCGKNICGKWQERVLGKKVSATLTGKVFPWEKFSLGKVFGKGKERF